MNPSSYNSINSGLIKENPWFNHDSSKILKQQAVRSHIKNLQQRKSRAAVWNRPEKTSLTSSTINSHETTPLFGLWQGYNSTKVSRINTLKNSKVSSGLFLPGQNETSITAHIGTTVIMDCKIVIPDL